MLRRVSLPLCQKTGASAAGLENSANAKWNSPEERVPVWKAIAATDELSLGVGVTRASSGQQEIDSWVGECW